VGAAPSAADAWNEKWRDLSARPTAAPLTREREALLEQLARTDPQRARTLAEAEAKWLIRDQRRAAALRGCASAEPEAAAGRAMQQPARGERRNYGSAVLAGAAALPEAALRAGLPRCTDGPEPAGYSGQVLITAFVDRVGDFGSAMRFAASANMVGFRAF